MPSLRGISLDCRVVLGVGKLTQVEVMSHAKDRCNPKRKPLFLWLTGNTSDTICAESHLCHQPISVLSTMARDSRTSSRHRNRSLRFDYSPNAFVRYDCPKGVQHSHFQDSIGTVEARYRVRLGTSYAYANLGVCHAKVLHVGRTLVSSE